MTCDLCEASGSEASGRTWARTEPGRIVSKNEGGLRLGVDSYRQSARIPPGWVRGPCLVPPHHVSSPLANKHLIRGPCPHWTVSSMRAWAVSVHCGTPRA